MDLMSYFSWNRAYVGYVLDVELDKKSTVMNQNVHTI